MAEEDEDKEQNKELMFKIIEKILDERLFSYSRGQSKTSKTDLARTTEGISGSKGSSFNHPGFY